MIPEFRIWFCQRYPARHDLPVEVWHRPACGECGGSASFAMLQTCGSVWVCPVCAGRIAEKRRQELAQALEVHRSAGGAVHLITYTARHELGMSLWPFLEGLLEAVRYMRSRAGFTKLRRRYGHVGSVRALEMTVGRHGWHPHFHELWFGEAGDVGGLAAAIRRHWMSALEREGLEGLPAVAADVRPASMGVDEYVSKIGHLRRWDVDAELTKAISKRGHGTSLTPFDLLRFGLIAEGRPDRAADYAEARRLFREYAEATKGKSSLRWSPGLRDRLGLGPEQSDVEVAALPDEGSNLLGLIHHHDWWRIMVADARLEVLAAAATGEWAAVQAVIDALPVPERFNKFHAAVARSVAEATPADRQRVYEAELMRMAGG